MSGRAIVAIIAAAIMGVAGATVSATAADAATAPIQVSTDGVHFGSTIPDALFDGVRLVPGGSADRPLWVKNTAGSSGRLAIAIKNVSSVQPAVLPSFSISGRTSALIGPQVFFDQVNPCAPILRRIDIGAGQAVRIDLALALDSALSGMGAQQSMAAFDLSLSLASSAVPAPDGCTEISTGGGGSGGDGSGGGGTVTIPGSTVGGDPDAAPAPDPSATPTPAPTPGPVDGQDGIIVANTGRFFQEYFVGGWVLGAVLGGLIAWLILRRRERHDA